MDRIGVYGGTFDPLHNAHIVVATAVRHALGLDQVLMVPAGDPWQKQGEVVASKEWRVRMTDLAVADLDGIEVSRIEIDHDGPSVTADTLEVLASPDRELFLIVGADAARNMSTWRRLDETAELATLVVVEREGERAEPPDSDWRVAHVSIPRVDVSSSDIRARIAAGRPIDGLVPPSVVRFITDHDIYNHEQ